MVRHGLRSVEVSLDRWQSLVRFAAVARVDSSPLSRADLAREMGKKGANLHTALYGRPDAESDTISRTFLQQLERTLRMVSDQSAPAHYRWPLTTLTGLREELSEEREPEPGARVHGAWFEDLCAAGPARNAVEVLVRGEALHDLLLHRKQPPGLASRWPLDASERKAVTDLLAIVGLPPSTGMAAIRVLARIGVDALPEIKNEIYQSPVGFRSLRPLSRMSGQLRRNHTPGQAWSERDVAALGAVETLLRQLVDQEPTDPCLGRGFFVEALRAAPSDPPPGTWGWVDDELDALVHRDSRPVRERMFALGVAVERLPPVAGEDYLRRVEADGEIADDPGLTWTADLIRDRLLRGAGPSPSTDRDQRWPRDRAEVAIVERVRAQLDGLSNEQLPISVRSGAQYLLAEALLTYDETRRRKACDVLNVAHLSDVVAPAVAGVFHGPDRAPRWLREHTAYVLGYLDGHDALDPLRVIVEDPSEHPTVLHAAAWGLGDSCGGTPGDHRACMPVAALTALLDHERAAPRHAAAYALAIVRPPGAMEVLRDVADAVNADRTTRALARWGQRLREADRNSGRLDAPIVIRDARTLIVGEGPG